MSKVIYFFLLVILLFPAISLSSEKSDTRALIHDIVLNSKEWFSEGMVFIKGGCFDMGDTFGDGGSDEKPVHEVCVDDFYMGKHEITVGEFRSFINDTDYKTDADREGGCYYLTGNGWIKDNDKTWREPGFLQSDRYPVVCVSWNDANSFAEWLSKKTGRKYRLPTEAEWEYAARSRGKKFKYSWGNGEPSGNIMDESAKIMFSGWKIWEGYNDGYVYSAPVGSFRANEVKLYDMTGNVWEWVQDWYARDYYKNSPRNNPKGLSHGESRVVRGGSFAYLQDYVPWDIRVFSRGWIVPWERCSDLGFRIVSPATKRETEN